MALFAVAIEQCRSTETGENASSDDLTKKREREILLDAKADGWDFKNNYKVEEKESIELAPKYKDNKKESDEKKRSSYEKDEKKTTSYRKNHNDDDDSDSSASEESYRPKSRSVGHYFLAGSNLHRRNFSVSQSANHRTNSLT